MKYRMLTFAALFFSSTALAQQNPTVQLECHDLASTGNVLAPDETLVSGMACRPIRHAIAAKQGAAAQVPATPTRSGQAL
jgi:hypothetical protein